MSLGPWQTQRQGSQRSVVGGYKEDYSSKQYDHITLLITSLFSLLLLLHKNRLRHILKSNCVPSPVVLLCIFLSPAVTASPAHFLCFGRTKRRRGCKKKTKKTQLQIQRNKLEYTRDCMKTSIVSSVFVVS